MQPFFIFICIAVGSAVTGTPLKRAAEPPKSQYTELIKEIMSLHADLPDDAKILEIQQQALCLREAAYPEISEIPYEGTPGATNYWGAGHEAEKAFQVQPKHSYPYATSTDLPATVWFKFDEPQIVAKISLRSRNDMYEEAQQAPADLTFKGSDDCEDWKTIMIVDDADFTERGQKREFQIPCSARGAYRCYGIEVSRNRGTLTSGCTRCVSFANVVMYG